ncbi:MAG: lytic transglycosylase domain-containing protein [Vulcanimicrobiaceae bacterium]
MPRAAQVVSTTLLFFACTCSAAVAATRAPLASPTAFAHVIRAVNPRLRPVQSRIYADALLASSRNAHVDPTLVMAVVTVESHWNTSALSWRGAEGLGQLMPGTAHTLGVDPWSSRQNLSGVAHYLHRLLGLFATAHKPLAEALAGYNAGPLAVKRYGGIPPYAETQAYVGRVLSTWGALRWKVARLTPRAHPATVLLDRSPLAAAASSELRYWLEAQPAR